MFAPAARKLNFPRDVKPSVSKSLHTQRAHVSAQLHPTKPTERPSSGSTPPHSRLWCRLIRPSPTGSTLGRPQPGRARRAIRAWTTATAASSARSPPTIALPSPSPSLLGEFARVCAASAGATTARSLFRWVVRWAVEGKRDTRRVATRRPQGGVGSLSAVRSGACAATCTPAGTDGFMHGAITTAARATCVCVDGFVGSDALPRMSVA